jgi:TorA maturation chaperone TorD
MTLTVPSSPSPFDPALNRARQMLYRFTALALLDPRQGSWERLEALGNEPVLMEAARLVRECPAACAETLGPGERPLSALDPQTVLDRLPASAAGLNERFEATFGLLVSSGCPPYETEYVPAKHAFQRAQALADISGFYRAFGLRPAAVLKERDDHIVLQLEFMAFLLGLERRAAEGAAPDDSDCRDVCRRAQARFLGEHLAWWAPALARLLAREDTGGYYEAVGFLLAALVPAERALLGVPLSSGIAEPSRVERPEECDHCLLAT